MVWQLQVRTLLRLAHLTLASEPIYLIATLACAFPHDAHSHTMLSRSAIIHGCAEICGRFFCPRFLGSHLMRPSSSLAAAIPHSALPFIKRASRALVRLICSICGGGGCSSSSLPSASTLLVHCSDDAQ